MNNPNQPNAPAAAPWAQSRRHSAARDCSQEDAACAFAKREIAELASEGAHPVATHRVKAKKPRPTLRERIAPRLSPEVFAKVRRHALRARHGWRESEAVFRAAMARLFYVARNEVAQGLAGPYRLRRA